MLLSNSRGNLVVSLNTPKVEQKYHLHHLTDMRSHNETILIVWQTCDLPVGVNRNIREKSYNTVGNTMIEKSP